MVSSANLYLTMRITTIVKSVDGNDIVIIECSNILNSEGFIKGKKTHFFYSQSECFFTEGGQNKGIKIVLFLWENIL